ncbi:phospholipase D1-like [Ictalurus furcatus]|uniref:phospholipase D1-like n=1 Tax=Ictalurus furcatus TaxID=66913 RepID=UPI002350D40B|nr:phospholipase D1-like [Ictalurus furcatus]XP_053503811.1 phospholipase D1-like [Ictalurus furcatus]XP_053503818.1 phospholipase D1-like [Ictalurus furcatus]
MASSKKNEQCWHVANTPLIFRVMHIEYIDEDQYLITLHLTHGQFSWTIKRLFKYLNGSCKKQQKSEHMAEKTPSDSTKRMEELKYLKEDLTITLKKILHKSYYGMMEFLGISPLSFIKDLGPKGPEGFILKALGRHRLHHLPCLWLKCWLVVKDSFLLYMSRDHEVLYVMLFDPELKVLLEEDKSSEPQDLVGEDRINPKLQILVEEERINPELQVSVEEQRINPELQVSVEEERINPELQVSVEEERINPELQVSVEEERNNPELQVLEENCKVSMCIQNARREMTIKCNSYRQAQWWKEEIDHLSEHCDFLKTHRFDGFAPPRSDSLTKWYVNGSGYFSDLADALEKAEEEIFITDWWINPEIFLKCPAKNTYWRLDHILKRKAEAGVKVSVLLYKEITFARGINSSYSKRTLMDLHPNIKVMRHPDDVASGVFLWSHHEKMVAIDQSVAFMGGLDLAFGRWDDNNYRLTDVVESCTDIQGACSDPETKGNDVPVAGRADEEKDYNNFFFTKDWEKLNNPYEDNVDQTHVPRIPWRDVGALVYGKAARDLARHFIQRWNFTKNSMMKCNTTIYPYLLPKSHTTADMLPFTEPEMAKASVQVLRSVGQWSAGTFECSIQKAYVDTIKNSQHYIYIENQFFISVDETAGTSCADKTPKISNGIADAIVDRILHAHKNGQKYRVFVAIPLLTGFGGDISKGVSDGMRAVLHYTYSTISCGKKSIISRLETEMKDEWRQYFSLCSMRTHSELIYINSKLLIADDRRYIIGSANINNRSLLGYRDSELAVLVVDDQRVPSLMNREEYEAGPLALALRKECFRVLLGAAVDIDDPVSDHFFTKVWNKIAHSNTSIYETLSTRPSNQAQSEQARE